jgi:hypothetical protein
VLWLRFAKLLGVLVLATGTVAAVFPGLEGKVRKRFAYLVAGPGFGVTWIAGLLLVHWRGHSMLSTWVVGSLAGSLISLQGVLYAAGRERTSLTVASVALVPLVIVLALMVWRPL